VEKCTRPPALIDSEEKKGGKLAAADRVCEKRGRPRYCRRDRRQKERIAAYRGRLKGAVDEVRLRGGGKHSAPPSAGR